MNSFHSFNSAVKQKRSVVSIFCVLPLYLLKQHQFSSVHLQILCGGTWQVGSCILEKSSSVDLRSKLPLSLHLFPVWLDEVETRALWDSYLWQDSLFLLSLESRSLWLYVWGHCRAAEQTWHLLLIVCWEKNLRSESVCGNASSYLQWLVYDTCTHTYNMFMVHNRYGVEQYATWWMAKIVVIIPEHKLSHMRYDPKKCLEKLIHSVAPNINHWRNNSSAWTRRFVCVITLLCYDVWEPWGV